MNSRILLLPVIGATTFFILLFSFTKIFGPIPFSVNSVTTQKSTTFDVTGEGKVSIAPDIASISVGIIARESTVKSAQEKINGVINNISDAVKKLGVDKKDIQTTNYSIYPIRGDFQAGPSKITAYEANTNLQIKVRDIDKVNSIIDVATANGANEVSGISFEVDDRTKAENEAREEAVEEAKRKADNAAKIAGFKLGRIINYSENFGDFPRPISLRAQGATEVESIPTQIEPGSSEIKATVTLSYEIL